MSAHLTDELPRLLTGEASHEAVLEAAAHLRTCVDCQQELVSAVVAHASLTSAQRFAPEIVARGQAGNFTHHADTDIDIDIDERVQRELPDLSVVFAQVRQEAEEGFRPDRRPGHGRRYLVAVAAAVVLAGAGTGIYFATTGGGSSAPTSRTVALNAFDMGTTSATAHISNGTIDLTATSLPKLTAQRYEVWLTNDKRTQMQPIGWISDNGTAKITVPMDLMKHYDDLEVSIQNVAAHSYDFSGMSVLRGAID